MGKDRGKYGENHWEWDVLWDIWWDNPWENLWDIWWDNLWDNLWDIYYGTSTMGYLLWDIYYGIFKVYTLWFHQTWLAMENPRTECRFLSRKIMDKWSMFQHATFEYRRVYILNHHWSTGVFLLMLGLWQFLASNLWTHEVPRGLSRVSEVTWLFFVQGDHLQLQPERWLHPACDSIPWLRWSSAPQWSAGGSGSCPSLRASLRGSQKNRCTASVNMRFGVWEPKNKEKKR